MAKYARDLDETLVQKVKSLATEFGLKEQGINVEALRLKKGKTYGTVVKGNDLVRLFAGEDIVAIALYEEVLLACDEQTQKVLIENLLEQIQTEEDKNGDTMIKLEKPQLSLGIQTYHKYGNIAPQKLEAALLVIEQIKENEKAEKEAKKLAKKNKKQED